MLHAANVRVEVEETTSEKIIVEVQRSQVTCKEAWNCSIGYDASAIPYYEIVMSYLNKGSLYDSLELKDADKQGDWVFSSLFRTLLKKKSCVLSITNTPDLAPALWAAAVLFGKELEIHSTPQLHLKESNRASMLVKAFKALGGMAEVRGDGLRISTLGANPKDCMLKTYGDHRLAMAFGVLQFRWPSLQIDDTECVRKSFPKFWQGLEFIRKCQL